MSEFRVDTELKARLDTLCGLRHGITLQWIVRQAVKKWERVGCKATFVYKSHFTAKPAKIRCDAAILEKYPADQLRGILDWYALPIEKSVSTIAPLKISKGDREVKYEVTQ